MCAAESLLQCTKEQHNGANILKKGVTGLRKKETMNGPTRSETNFIQQGVMQRNVSLSHHAPCFIPTTVSPETSQL